MFGCCTEAMRLGHTCCSDMRVDRQNEPADKLKKNSPSFLRSWSFSSFGSFEAFLEHHSITSRYLRGSSTWLAQRGARSWLRPSPWPVHRIWHRGHGFGQSCTLGSSSSRRRGRLLGRAGSSRPAHDQTMTVTNTPRVFEASSEAFPKVPCPISSPI